MAYEPRGRIDLERGSNLYYQEILRKRAENERFPPEGMAREDSEGELQRRQVRENLPPLSGLAKLAGIAGVGYLVGTAIGRRRLASVLGAIGDVGYNIRKEVTGPLRHTVGDSLIGLDPTA